MRARHRRLPLSLIAGAVLLVSIALLAVVAPLIWGDSATALSSDLRAGSSAAHPLGTDAVGRDVLARTLVATRLSIVMALATTGLAVGAGVLLGVASVLTARGVRNTVERGIDLFVAYPPVLVALAVAAIVGPSATSMVIAIGAAFTPQFARLANALAASVRSSDYVIAAEQLGIPRRRVLRRHLLPNLAGPLLVLTSVSFGSAIITLSGLSFLGLGTQDPSFDWGKLLALGLRDLRVNSIEAIGPIVAVLLTGLAAGLVGDGLNVHLDPRQRGRARGRAPAKPRSKASASPLAEDASDLAVAVHDLRIAGEAELVRGVSLAIRRGEIFGLVGESGSGKSLTAMTIARLLPSQLAWSASVLSVNGRDLNDPGVPAPSALGTEVGMVFQDPSSCFNPARRIGAQITEVARVHGGMSRRRARAAAIEHLRQAGVSAPELRMRQFPHELSGGMSQRAMIAAALMTSPAVLIADEPTTALDVTVQAGVLRLLKRLNAEHGTAILLISHDINVVSALCERVGVMYAGRVVEELTVEDLRVRRVRHPYTRALLAASPMPSDADQAELVALPGRPPSPGTPLPGCAFADRCPMVEPLCRRSDPSLRPLGARGRVACHVTSGPLVEAGDVRA
jgi:peptide/nickel transport system permease protein